MVGRDVEVDRRNERMVFVDEGIDVIVEGGIEMFVESVVIKDDVSID